MEVEQILSERGKTHGDFATHAHVSQSVKSAVYGSVVGVLTAAQTEAIDMIAHKLARIAAGDPNHIDHWVDIAGYATLVVKELEKKAGE